MGRADPGNVGKESSGLMQYHRLANDPPQLDGPPIQHFAFLGDDDARGEIVDFAGDRWQRLDLLVLARLMIETQR